MPTLVTAIAEPQVPVGTRTRLALVFRRKRRHAIKQLLHYAKLVKDQDQRDIVKGQIVGYNPITFQIAPNNPVALSLGQVIRRAQDCMALTN